MSEHAPTEDEIQDQEVADADGVDESRRDFLKSTLAVGAGVALGTFAPAENAEGGVLDRGVLKAAAARAALKSAEQRMMSHEDKATLAELEKAEMTAGKECNAEFNAYMRQNSGKTDKDFLKTQIGIDCYSKWTEARRKLLSFKK